MSEPENSGAMTDLKCAVCGVVLTVGELEAAAGLDTPLLCTPHLAEAAPIEVAAPDDPEKPG
jgi:hypothetical protein